MDRRQFLTKTLRDGIIAGSALSLVDLRTVFARGAPPPSRPRSPAPRPSPGQPAARSCPHLRVPGLHERQQAGQQPAHQGGALGGRCAGRVAEHPVGADGPHAGPPQRGKREHHEHDERDGHRQPRPALDALGVPADLRAGFSFSDNDYDRLLNWANPNLPDKMPDPYTRSLTPDEIEEISRRRSL